MKRYILEVEVDEHGECFITLPDEIKTEGCPEWKKRQTVLSYMKLKNS